MKRLSSRARRLTALLVLAAGGLGLTAGTAALTGHHQRVAYPHFACAGVDEIGICIGPPGSG